ncbi:hypothetical protein NBZ79_12095 [Sneathiella marina]|uniref:Glycerophosphoryl diester phosphodiesterase membrane domain-containing protein n=1 Tax=Sneathiella marina TaxID=2950108 RepID=A0ABY4VZ09_9PROT|nr:hypothetical protein [Sneathiella marina]USG59917.1 hypothetical protein NBZ79_12095 [Sneathiella marina]
MIGEVRPTICLFDAFRFVLAHRWPCLIRAVPVILLTGIMTYLESSLLAAAEYFSLVMKELIYAIFAVFWHRYVLRPDLRGEMGFGLAFGLREIKFAAALLGFVVISYLLGGSLVSAVGVKSVSSVFVIIAAVYLCFLPFIFLFPAIALDQPLQIGLFVRRILDILVPLIGTIFLGLVAIVGISVLLYLPGIVIALRHPDLGDMVLFVTSSFVIAPFVLAVTITFVSFLYRTSLGVVIVDPA